MAFEYRDLAVVTSLVRAIINNNVEDVRAALRKGFSPNLPDNRGWTPVHEAAVDDNRIECLKELLSHTEANINAKTFSHETPLYLACKGNCIKNVKCLLQQPKCDVNVCQLWDISPLHAACTAGNLEIVKNLIECGAKVSVKDVDNYTPLHAAVVSHRLRKQRDEVSFQICKLLLDHGANPDEVEYQGNRPFHLACQNGLLKCVNLLLSVSKVNDLINCKNNDERTPLMIAVSSLNLSVLEFLLSNGANANITDSMSVTALHLAAHTGIYDVFSLILRETSKESVLKYCTFDEERDFALLTSKKLNSLICLAIDTEDLAFVTGVLESDLDPAALKCPVVHAENSATKTYTLHTPISFLLECKMCELGCLTMDFLDILIAHGCSLKVTSKHPSISYINPICAGLVALNDTPSDIVLKCLKYLLQKGADPDEPDGRMPFAMEQAIMRQNVEAVMLLLQYTNVLEPESILHWMEEETSGDQEDIIEVLLPLAPYYKPTDKLFDLIENPMKKALLVQKVYPLTYYCRTIVREQVHYQTESCPHFFRQYLSELEVPRDVSLFLNYK